MSGWRWAESILILLPVRLGLAGLFGLAAASKIADPQAFAFAVKAYRVFDPEDAGHAIVMLAFGIPWAEMLVALMLVLGLWTRGASLLLTLMLVGFTVGILSLISREIDASCACFGEVDFICEGAAGWCHVGRNAVLLVASLLLVWRGGGGLSLDAMRPRRAMDTEETPA